MKNNEISFTTRTIIFWCVIVVAILVLAFVITGIADAQSINQREWLLEYEQVSGYPAPAEEPTVTYAAPAEEPTATAKPKPKKKDSNCSLEPTDAWWREMRLGQAYFYVENNVKIYCFGYPPIPFYEDKTVPTPIGETPGSGYPAPVEEPTATAEPLPTATPKLIPTWAPTMDLSQDQLPLCFRTGWTPDYGFYFAVPCEEGEIP
jgi:hypothetical protein